MTKVTRFSATTALVAASLALPALGWAQTQPQSPAAAPPAPSAAAPAASTPAVNTPPPAAQAGPTAMLGGHGRHGGFDLGADVERHLKTLHSQLRITPAEEPQWSQFAQVMRDNAQGMMQSLDARAQKVTSMDAVDSMTSYAQLAEQHAQDLGKLAAAFQTLYASFPDDQKKQADEFFRRQATEHMAQHGSHHKEG